MKKYTLFFIAAFVLATVGYAWPKVSVDTDELASVNAIEKKDNKVIQMNLDLFKQEVFDYTKSKDWSFQGEKPAVIDLYADWCGPCRMIAPILRDLSVEYDGKVTFYKVNVDKERELAQLFNVTSIPLLVFIPKEGTPMLFPGAADKSTYKKTIEEFLLGNKK